jgi:hypothetical protein
MSSKCLFHVLCSTHYTICPEVTGRNPIDTLDEGICVFPLSTSYCIPLQTPVAYISSSSKCLLLAEVVSVDIHFSRMGVQLKGTIGRCAKEAEGGSGGG